MFEEIISKDGQLDDLVLERSYVEAMDLSNNVVEYFKENKKEHFKDLDVDVMGYYTLECNRVTTSIMQAMSWCLMQKGVKSGEITKEEASKSEHRMPTADLYLVPIACETDQFPNNFMGYSKRAKELYEKIVRLDRVLYDGVRSDKINPVQSLIKKIEKSNDL